MNESKCENSAIDYLRLWIFLCWWMKSKYERVTFFNCGVFDEMNELWWQVVFFAHTSSSLFFFLIEKDFWFALIWFRCQCDSIRFGTFSCVQKIKWCSQIFHVILIGVTLFFDLCAFLTKWWWIIRLWILVSISKKYEHVIFCNFVCFRRNDWWQVVLCFAHTSSRFFLKKYFGFYLIWFVCN